MEIPDMEGQDRDMGRDMICQGWNSDTESMEDSLSDIVKWQNTTRSWSGEPELIEGTWLQLMCCTPSRSCCPKFQSNRVHGVSNGIPEYTREDGEDGETRGSRKWVHYGQYMN